jgi:pseudaminic acid biosynthesis-associated methylase
MEITQQMEWWISENGKRYTLRNIGVEILSPEDIDKKYLDKFGTSRTQMNLASLSNIDRKCSVLEVGTNVGDQLILLKNMGFSNLSGIEIQQHAVDVAKSRADDINFHSGSIFNIPFPDNSFDIVFTSGVLIHIAPPDLIAAISEIHRVSRRYIWGFEYFSEDYINVPYHGSKNLLWKTDFCKIYLETFVDLKQTVKTFYNYVEDQNVDCMFLLEKT